MNCIEIEQRIEDLENMIEVYKLILTDKLSPLYEDKLINSFMDSHLDELFNLKMKLIYSAKVN